MITPKLRSYHLSELITYNKAVINLITNANAVTLKLEAASNALQTVNNKVDAAYAYQKDSPITLELEQIDAQRDAAVVGINLVANGNSRHFDASNANAANAILSCYNKYGSSIANLNYNAETGVIDSLLNDLETDATLVAATTLLNLSTWVAHLKTTNNNFKEKYAARTAQFASQPAETAFALRPQAIEAYKKLIKRIESLNNLDEAGTYTTLINNINTLTQQYNTTAERRSSGGETLAPTPPVNNG
jgi:hypothetical protein